MAFRHTTARGMQMMRRLIRDAVETEGRCIGRFDRSETQPRKRGRLIAVWRRPLALFMLVGLAFLQISEFACRCVIAADARSSINEPDVKAFAFAMGDKYINEVGKQNVKTETNAAFMLCTVDSVGVDIIQQMHFARYAAIQKLPPDSSSQEMKSWLQSLGTDGDRAYNAFLKRMDEAYSLCMSQAVDAKKTSAKNASDAAEAYVDATLDCNDPHVQSMVSDSAMMEGVDPSVREDYLAKARAAMEVQFSDVRTEGTDASGRLICSATIKFKIRAETKRINPEGAKQAEAMSIPGKYAVYRLDSGKIRAESIH